MAELEGLIAAYNISSDGKAQPAASLEAGTMPDNTAWTWLDFDLDAKGARHWLRTRSGLTGQAADSVLQDVSRPRFFATPQGTLLILRGVNVHPGADPEDLVSVRLWIEDNRVISFHRHRLLAIDEIRNEMDGASGPKTPGDFIADLSDRLVSHMSEVMEDFDREIDKLEFDGASDGADSLRSRLTDVRMSIIPMRRYLAPQREALTHLIYSRVEWLDDWQRNRLRDALDSTMRYVEDLDEAKDRLSVIQEHFAARLAERMNRTMLTLAIVAAIFLPLGLLTGLLGINVAGIPGEKHPWAFWMVAGLAGVIIAVEIWLVRRLRLY